MKNSQWQYNQDRTAKDSHGLGIAGTEAWGEVFAITDGDRFVGFVLEEDDALVASAAPEMLEALRKIVDICGPSSRGGQIAQDAIAKVGASSTTDAQASAAAPIKTQLAVKKWAKRMGIWDDPGWDRLKADLAKVKDEREGRGC